MPYIQITYKDSKEVRVLMMQHIVAFENVNCLYPENTTETIFKTTNSNIGPEYYAINELKMSFEEIKKCIYRNIVEGVPEPIEIIDSMWGFD